MTTPYLLSGSFAYDSILLHEGAFHSKILPEHISRLNVAFGVDDVENQFGGCAGNISYNATLFGQKPLLVGSLGSDGEAYQTRLKEHGLNPNTLTYHDKQLTAHAWILTDQHNNQITAFHAGCMDTKPNLPAETPDLWHIAPENPQTMAWLAKTCVELGKKYYFDPGQALPGFFGQRTDAVFSLQDIVKNAKGIFVNEYEAELLKEHTDIDSLKFSQEGDKFFVITLGEKGSQLYYQGQVHEIAVAQAEKIKDPTGCGDSFRAGFLYAITELHKNPIDAVVWGSAIASFAIEESGGQNHHPTLEEIASRKAASYHGLLAPTAPARKPWKRTDRGLNNSRPYSPPFQAPPSLPKDGRTTRGLPTVKNYMDK